ncbi:MAG: GNAT family N-acetyltransferase [Flavobacteriales bacterium]|nr:GNAT family N-acetyltransferase [Flavobacteriales bacterium]
MIELKPLTQENITPFYSWLRDEETIKFSLTSFQKLESNDDINTWYSKLLLNQKDLTLGIFLASNGTLIGYTGICNISTINKNGEYFIFIGEKGLWGKGIGTITTQKVVQFGFEKLNLNRIMLTVSEPNIGGVRAYEKAGFKIEGKLRQACFRDGKFHDKIMMSILKEEFHKKYC